jgi:protein translocase SecG subunit
MDFILIFQAVLGVLLTLCVLLQQRAAGFTSGQVNTMVVQRRGAEKLLYQATVVLAVAFFGLTIVQWYV